MTAGPGTYTVLGDPGQHIEGGTYTFTVHRTDTSAAQDLTYNVSGDTNGGTVTAATPGTDFTAAGNTVHFAAGQADATFNVALNTDNNVEGLEGIKVQVFDGVNEVATTTGLISDANNHGQTFLLTNGIDGVGQGLATDVIGSEGSTNTVGQDTIMGTQSTINTFDKINGGADDDTFFASGHFQ